MSGAAATHRAPATLPRALTSVRHRTLVIAFVAIGALIRLLVATRGLDVVDRLFIPDDTYYTLSISRSLAHGHGPTVDGLHLTSGFQPLLAFLMAPVYAITDNPDTGLRVAVLLGALCDIGSAVLLGRLATRFAGTAAGVLAVAFWALSPIALSQALNGLETGLAVFLVLLFAELWMRADEHGGRVRWAAAGAVAGLAVLARVDAAFVVAALGVAALIRGHRIPVAIAGVAAAVVLAPWWIYCTIKFGSPVPESGAAVRELVNLHRERGLTTPDQMARAAGQILGAPLASFRSLRTALGEAPFFGVLAWLLVAGGAGAIAWRARRRIGAYGVALAAAGLALFAFYTFWLPAPWFFARYLAPVAALATILLAGIAVTAWRWRTTRLPDSALVLGAIGLLAAIAIGMTVPNIWRKPPMTPDSGFEGSKGYRQAAAEIVGVVPAGATIGSLQSGALEYYYGKRNPIVNLDGVVDAGAAKALDEHRLAAFARDRGVAYFADWSLNRDILVERAGLPGFSEANLAEVGRASPQGDDQFVVYQVNWPAR